MTTYYCKCGRPVKKSSNADNTGNRDTAGCEGCPYLLPWGPMVWEEGQKAYVQDVKGQECRMSPTINYATTYRGQADDKCTLHIVSLDLDFLDQVQAWIYDNAADTLSAGFSRGSIRAVEFCDQGRYSLSISCAQNKKGMAAKAALLDRFFTAGRGRRDMTLVQEKAHILDAIRKGKEQAQRKDTAMKKLNDRCPLQQECERTCKVIGHERDCDYYVNNRYCTEGIPDQDELLTAEELRQEREREERYLASLSAEPAEPVAYQNEYGTLFAVREHKGAPSLMCKAKGADSWALSGVLAAVRGEACTAADLQEVLDEYARAHGWEKAAPEQTKENYSPCEGCRCPDCDDEACPQAHCDKSDKGLGCIAPDSLCPPVNPTDAGADVPPCAPTASDAQTLPYPNADAGAKTGANGEVTACACAGCKRSDCICAGGHDVLGRADCDGHCNCSQSGCTYDIRHRANPTAAAPASRADAGAAEQSLSAAGPASLEADERMENPTSSDVATVAAGGTVASLEPSDSTSMMAAPAAKANEPKDDATESVLAMASGLTTFDFGADAETNVALMQDAQIFMAGSMARVMAAKRAHDRTANNYRGSWGKWCDLVGISRDTGDNMVRVAEQFGNIQVDGKSLIDIQPLKLLYAASKPSTPKEIRKRVENLDITTHKQYQEALTRIRTLENQNASLLHSYETERGKAEAADRRAEEEERKRKEANEGYAAAMETLRQAQEDAADSDARARAAENRAAGAQKLADQRGAENTELKAKLRELESRPVEVAVAQPGEDQIEAWRKEGEERMAATMQETVRKAHQETQKAKNQVTDLQEQLATARPDADACQRTVDILYEATENLRLLLRSQLKQAQLSPNAYGKVVAHVLQAARNLMDTVRVCSPDGYDMDSDEDDDFE